jgi:hypothetical protein
MLNGPSTKQIILKQLATLGLWHFYWCAQSRRDINTAAGKELIPPIWYLAIPGLNYWWAWHYAEALEIVTQKHIKASDTFGMYIIAIDIWILLLPIVSNIVSIYGDFNHKPSLGLVIGFFVAVLLAMLAIGSGLFCYLMQRKIDTVRSGAAH